MADKKISNLPVGVTLTASSLFEISKHNGATYASQKFTVAQLVAYLGFSSSLLLPSAGGTGIANNDNSTTTRVGSFPLTITLSASTSLTFPTTGTLATVESLNEDAAYKDLVYTGDNLTQVNIWEDFTMQLKLYQTDLTYDVNGILTQKQVQRIVDNFTYIKTFSYDGSGVLTSTTTDIL